MVVEELFPGVDVLVICVHTVITVHDAIIIQWSFFRGQHVSRV
jgi:hypothetical protein